MKLHEGYSITTAKKAFHSVGTHTLRRKRKREYRSSKMSPFHMLEIIMAAQTASGMKTGDPTWTSSRAGRVRDASKTALVYLIRNNRKSGAPPKFGVQI